MEKDRIVILVADRNRHVRELLRRVLCEEGYRVRLAGDGREVMTILEGENPPNLLILDPEIPLISVQILMDEFRRRHAPIPIVVHTFLPDCARDFEGNGEIFFVEKTGDTDLLRTTVDAIASRLYPDRYASRKIHATS